MWDPSPNACKNEVKCSTLPHCVQGCPVLMEHTAAINVLGMEAAEVTPAEYCYYHCRVRYPAELL